MVFLATGIDIDLIRDIGNWLSDSQLVGAAVGAFLSVGLGFWVATSRSARESKARRNAIRSQIAHELQRNARVAMVWRGQLIEDTEGGSYPSFFMSPPLVTNSTLALMAHESNPLFNAEWEETSSNFRDVGFITEQWHRLFQLHAERSINMSTSNRGGSIHSWPPAQTYWSSISKDFIDALDRLADELPKWVGTVGDVPASNIAEVITTT